MNAQPTCACPNCGGIEFITSPDSYDLYQAINDSLHWQKMELANCEFQLLCRECGERAPAEFADRVS